MKSGKSVNSISNQRPSKQLQEDANHSQSNTNSHNHAVNGHSSQSSTSPICRCRVMYLGSSVPHITKDGLQGIQEPLKELYPDKSPIEAVDVGIDSWLSVWSNGILIENVDETGREEKRFFKIDTLHYCAAVKYVPLQLQANFNPYSTLQGGNGSANIPNFLPLDSPHARQPNPNPPIFACILRRTTGIKVLECHGFICKREAAANALVRCCFHAYADTMYAKQIGADLSLTSSGSSQQKNSSLESPISNELRSPQSSDESQHQALSITSKRAKSIAALNDIESNQYEAWNGNKSVRSNCNNNEFAHDQHDSVKPVTRRKSIHNSGPQDDIIKQNQIVDSNNNLRSQQRFSKSMHQLNDPENGRPVMARDKDAWLIQQVNQQSFYNPYASRVPSYPPPSLNDNQLVNNGGTLRSIKSMAANSIASTLLRSKKHAKAMSMANDRLAVNSQVLPPVPSMFLHNMPRVMMNGSQTMRPLGSSASIMPLLPPPSFETMTPKEVKKLLKKNAKYGLDPQKMSENGLPTMLPLHNPRMPFPLGTMTPQQSKSATMLTNQSIFTDLYGQPNPALLNDLAPLGPMGTMKGRIPFPPPEQMKPIAMRPSSEFLKSKAGKKWLKQQRQFKKLLPPHLDGLPIVFGPPPMEAMEAAALPNNTHLQPFLGPHPGVPVMDSSGYYGAHPFALGQNGRASAASTLLRYSPQSQMPLDPNNHDIINDSDIVYGLHQSSMVFNHPPHQAPNLIYSGHREAMNDEFNSLNCDVGHQKQSSNRHHNQRHNQMVEQSVISLEDENDYDDDDQRSDDDIYHNYQSSSNGHMRESLNSDCRMIHTQPPRQPPPQPPKNRALDRYHHLNTANGDKAKNYQNSQPAYSQSSNQSNDDQNSYSSGIYKREHIGERAFSYSIRQEHKSNGKPEYAGTDRYQNGDSNHPARHQLDRNTEYQYHIGNNNKHISQVNELTSRLENQLKMRSFANSDIKNHN